MAERDAALEAAVLDLGLLVDLPADARPRSLARDRQRPVVHSELDRVRLDAGELDDDDQLMGLVGDEAVDGGPEAAAGSREPGHLPEVGEKLLHFAANAIDRVTRHGPMVAGVAHLTTWLVVTNLARANDFPGEELDG